MAAYKWKQDIKRIIRKYDLKIEFSNLSKALRRLPLGRVDQLLLVIRTLYAQQREMHSKRTKSVADRIVSIHQPHVRPIVRGGRRCRLNPPFENPRTGIAIVYWRLFSFRLRLIAFLSSGFF